jgi:flagellar motor switch/type III secretory pathway protein FliN
MDNLDEGQGARERRNLAHLGSSEVEGVVELDRIGMKLSQVRALRRGDVVELNRLAGEAFTLRLNGRPFAEGETVVVGEAMALRLTRLLEYAPQEATP